MIEPLISFDERERQLEVDKYLQPNTLPKDAYDNITSLISFICEVPISLISIIDKDKNFFRSQCGFYETEMPRNSSFCGHAIHSDNDIMIVTDARKDIRFFDNPAVLSKLVVFYAGVPLITQKGFKLGTLCVVDNKPRILSEVQKNALKVLAKQVMILFEQEFQNQKLYQLQIILREKNINLEKFANLISHDLKSPLANIIMLSNILEEENKGILNADSKLYLEYLKSSSISLKNYIDGILEYYKTDNIQIDIKENINLNLFFDELKNMVFYEKNVKLITHFSDNYIKANKAALQQILLNLLSNALRYNNKDEIIIEVNVSVRDQFYLFEVKDNGNGIPAENFKVIFDLFQTFDEGEKFGEKGSGIGLATVKKVIEDLGGKISLHSIVGQGSTFEFSTPI